MRDMRRWLPNKEKRPWRHKWTSTKPLEAHQDKPEQPPLRSNMEPLLPAVKPLSFSDSTRDMAHFTQIYWVRNK